MKTVCYALLFAVLVLGAESFDAASIKPASPDEAPYSGEDGRNGVLKMWNVSLKRCIGYAYKIPEGQILGGPKWVDQLNYDILAKADHPAGEPELLTMLQPLLADRFRLRLHHETRMVPGYRLTVAKGGIKTDLAAPEGHSAGNGGRGFFDVMASPPGALTFRLSALLGKPVIDMTGEKRRFDFHLRWTPDDAPAGGDFGTGDAPSLLTALQEQLGLRLESGAVQTNVLVIDNAEPPSAN